MLQGIIAEIENDVFTPALGSSSNQFTSLDSVEDSEIESSLKPDAIESSWIYIKGLLSANSMELDRLHSLLNLSQGCSSNDVTYLSIKRLELLLETKVKSKELSLSNGIYCLS
ncbi:hypothetical protein LOD99_12150 [Oopsacas minuta]|uniref:Anaphase-promoting complex subunit 2 C-terminal domain-containing protein n=1 Tax=Oopsacas minuta TaxID=111878 RepID=A0AAV7JIJ7_9METZ|nr:hypothetical protein LOD99_12150 [Oopsacas minuta]